MPTAKFAEAAHDVTLMIHEATMGDEEAALACQKKHSTFSQALEEGQQCVSQPFRKASHILITLAELTPNISS
jgi:ribonuclease BN (tRNA processing enzyme)